jgi:post-segregation antitoxin (ccd killing protein)
MNIMGRTKVVVSSVYEQLKERLKEVGLNISVKRTNTIVQNSTSREISEILAVKDMAVKVLGILNTWGL